MPLLSNLEVIPALISASALSCVKGSQRGGSDPTARVNAGASGVPDRPNRTYGPSSVRTDAPDPEGPRESQRSPVRRSPARPRAQRGTGMDRGPTAAPPSSPAVV